VLGRVFAWVAGVVLVLVLVAMSLVVRSEFERSTDLRQLVDQSYTRRAALQRFLSLHQDLETGQRGYIITGDESFLEPYDVARAQVELELAELLRSAEADPVGAPELRRLQELSAQKVMVTDAGVAARRATRSAEATAMVSSGRGKQVMDQIRTVVGALDASEAARLDEHVSSADSARRRAQRLALGLMTALAGLFLFAAYVALRTIAARRQTMEEAEDAAARYRAILQSAKDGIITLNPSGSIEEANDAAARMFGYRPRELQRRDVGTLFEIAPDTGAVETFLKRLRLKGGQEGRIEEFSARRKDGSLVSCEVAVSRMDLVGGIYFVAIIRDITERKHVEQMKSEFVSTVSHELRTPRTSIAGSLGLIAGGAAGPLGDRAARLVNIALTNSKRLVRLINDILDIEKIESGQMRFEISRVPLAPFLEQAIAANQAYAAEQGAELEIGPIPKDAIVLADHDRLMQVITNLVSNASKFSPAGERVRISVQPLDRRWRISVADKGSGIPEEFRKRIFQKFAQADSSDTRAKGGTGLGLSIVREIMTRLGGAISFDTSAGAGTTFHVDIPAAPPAVSLERPSTIGLPSILHVDDDPDVLRVVASAFEARATVHAATSLAAARQALEARPHDLIIIDIGLPDGSGLDLLSETASPTVVFTAQDSNPEVRQRADAVLTKSRANLDQLVAAAERLLERREPE
jgi:PAS domain S-box-containing protein